MDVLLAGAFFQSELSLAVRADDVAVGLEVAELHILALEEAGHGVVDADEAVVLIHALGDVGGQRAEDRQRAHEDDHDREDRRAHEKIHEVQHAREDPDKGIQFIVSVAPLHEGGEPAQKISQTITVFP